jgi:hypothetical protein
MNKRPWHNTGDEYSFPASIFKTMFSESFKHFDRGWAFSNRPETVTSPADRLNVFGGYRRHARQHQARQCDERKTAAHESYLSRNLS